MMHYYRAAAAAGIPDAEPPEPPEPAVSALYWRIYITSNTTSTGYASIAEIEMRATAGGVDQCTGGTASASSTLGGAPASSAFDNNPATFWATSNGGKIPSWIRYQFPSAVVVSEVTIQARTGGQNDVNQTPSAFEVQHSSNGVDWTTLSSHTPPTWAAGEIRAFLVQ